MKISADERTAQMKRSIQRFTDIFTILKNDLEVFRYPVMDLIDLYDESYKESATFILQKLEEFAARNGNTLNELLCLYADYTKKVVAERILFKKTGRYLYTSEAEIRHIIEDRLFKLKYMYILTLSTLLNRSRYELFLHYRRMAKKYLQRGSTILEIGGGNCLDSKFISAYGKVDVYELNEMSLLWLEVLNLSEEINLKIA